MPARSKGCQTRVAVALVLDARFGPDERVSRQSCRFITGRSSDMVDPNFRRTVLFVSEHEPNEGALG